MKFENSVGKVANIPAFFTDHNSDNTAATLNKKFQLLSFHTIQIDTYSAEEREGYFFPSPLPASFCSFP